MGKKPSRKAYCLQNKGKAWSLHGHMEAYVYGQTKDKLTALLVYQLANSKPKTPICFWTIQDSTPRHILVNPMEVLETTMRITSLEIGHNLINLFISFYL